MISTDKAVPCGIVIFAKTTFLLEYWRYRTEERSRLLVELFVGVAQKSYLPFWRSCFSKRPGSPV
jgi:hypothetical protein